MAEGGSKVVAKFGVELFWGLGASEPEPDTFKVVHVPQSEKAMDHWEIRDPKTNALISTISISNESYEAAVRLVKI